MTAAKSFRELLSRRTIIRGLGAHDAFSARVMEQAGVELLFLGGFGISASQWGLPDLGLITRTEMADAVRRITSCVNVPLIADGDTGYGGPEHVARTVRDFERAGAAGIILEDQVADKRCGHFRGKRVIPTEEMCEKLQAALAARSNPDFALFARTDALAVEGVAAAVQRANRYGETGADVCFVEAPRNRDQLAAIPKEVPYPLLANMLVGGTTPILSADELEQLGYQIMVSPVAGLLMTGSALTELTKALLESGRVDDLQTRMLSFEQLKQMLGLEEFLQRTEADQ
jgi:2-methylisocitrate lyase-like PEP mutase family enzyme